MTKRIVIILSLLFSFISLHAEQPRVGYRGIVDWASEVKLDISLYGGEATNSLFYTGVSVSQGYQLKRWLYLGGGVMAQQCVKDNSIYAAPLFGHVRTDLAFGRFTPFADVRAGYNFANYGGIYCSATIGYRVNWGRKVGINIGFGFANTGNRAKIEYVSETLGPDGMGGTWTTWHRVHRYNTTLSLRLGVDF